MLFVTLFALAALLIVVWSLLNGIGPMPSTRRQRKALLQCLPKSLNGTAYELGSGWGTLALAVARQHPGCSIVGYENSPVPFLFSRLLLSLRRLPNVEFRYGNIHTVPLKDASLVLCYLYPGAMQELKQKLEKELAPGTHVVSNTFHVRGWEPHHVEEVRDLFGTKIYVYNCN
jgi:trans-aconitate methyltransferase